MIVKTNVLDYVLAAILLIIMEEKEVYLVTFYFYMFKAAKLNYNTYNKELLMIFEAFCIWCHFGRIRVVYRHYYRPQEFRVLLHYQNSFLLLSKIV